MTTPAATTRGTLSLPVKAGRLLSQSSPALPAPALTEDFSFDLSVFIARTQPPTIAHIMCIRRALQAGRRTLLLSGSAFQSRSPRNMLFFSERESLLRGALTPEENERLDIVPLPDCYSDKQWQLQVRRSVRETALARGFGTRARICLVGHNKDASSYYLNMFPGWESVETGGFNDISATPARDDFLAHGGEEAHAAVRRWSHILPENVQAFMHSFAESDGYEWLMGEIEWDRRSRARQASMAENVGIREWQEKPTVTTEVVVYQSGHVLMARRLKRPGLGLLTLPGDLLRKETFTDGALRVMVGLHRLMVQPTRKPDMAHSLLADKIGPTVLFDHPYRSALREQLITGCHLIELRADRRGLAPVGPGTDTEQAIWMPVDDVDPQECFEDRYHVLNHMLHR